VTILLSDSRVSSIPVRESGEPVVELPAPLGEGTYVRQGVADRLREAALQLPAGYGLLVVEGHRSRFDQLAIIDRYSAQLRTLNPRAGAARIRHLSSRFVAPLAVAPHVAAAAVDLTLVGPAGIALDMGTSIDATPEESDGACYFGARNITPAAREHRRILADCLGGAGFVNYPTEWWHWSFGDRYWALATGAAHAPYGPIERGEAA
jgi:D-alanyl-D-alanine dipeptidase